MKTFILILIVFCSCEGSQSYREKHGEIHSKTEEYDIQSIRVDDDSEYHIVAVSRITGGVITISDADFHGYTMDELKVNYSHGVVSPVLYIDYNDRHEVGNFTQIGPYRAVLPYGFKIETFED